MSCVLLHQYFKKTGSYCDFLMLCKIYTQDEVEVPVTSWVPKGERERGKREGRKEGRGRKGEEGRERKEGRGREGGVRRKEGKASKQPHL